MRSVLLSVALVITHVTVIDTTGGALRPDATVLIRDGRIAAVGGPVPADARVVDGCGKFLIPGLWDMHVHLSWAKESALLALLANGVTGVRDAGDSTRALTSPGCCDRRNNSHSENRTPLN